MRRAGEQGDGKGRQTEFASIAGYRAGDAANGQEGGHHPLFERALLAELPLPRSLASRAAALAAEVRDQATALRATFDRGRALVADVETRLARKR